MKPHPPAIGLWWCTFIVVTIGGLSAWMISLDQTIPEWRNRASAVIAVTVVLAGICVISKLSSWWIRR